jgi:hypothetical protein
METGPLTTHSCDSHRDDGIRNRPKDGLRANDATMCVDQVLETLDPRPLRRIWRGRAPIASVEDEPENEWGSVVLEESRGEHVCEVDEEAYHVVCRTAVHIAATI